jgi:hypothetical protein
MKNKEIAIRVGTTEQVVKNYLRKVYDKLGVADRLELALYCLSHHVVDGVKPPPVPVASENGGAAKVVAASAGNGGAAASTPTNTARVDDANFEEGSTTFPPQKPS